MVFAGSRSNNERNARGDVIRAGGARILKRGYEKEVELLNKGEGIYICMGAFVKGMVERLCVLAWYRGFKN